jgi:hypothetical protein
LKKLRIGRFHLSDIYKLIMTDHPVVVKYKLTIFKKITISRSAFRQRLFLWRAPSRKACFLGNSNYISPKSLRKNLTFAEQGGFSEGIIIIMKRATEISINLPDKESFEKTSRPPKKRALRERHNEGSAPLTEVRGSRASHLSRGVREILASLEGGRPLALKKTGALKGQVG